MALNKDFCSLRFFPQFSLLSLVYKCKTYKEEPNFEIKSQCNTYIVYLNYLS